MHSDQISDSNPDCGIPQNTPPKFSLGAFFRKQKQVREIKQQQKTCAHLFRNAIVEGSIGSPQMHPHPLFAERVQVRLQPFATVGVCFFCQKVKAEFGYNEFSVEKTLPGLDLKNERIPKRA